ncbi:methyltransferase [archaeon]|nr:methyltransferase [archaeon]
MTKKELAISLSKMDVFVDAKAYLEQYPTDSEIAADVLWFAYLNNDIEDKVIADFGAGTGILGIGCMLLGAKKVYFIESDSKAIDVLKKNLERVKGDYKIINSDIGNFDKKVDLIVQNPPFGTKEKHTDVRFLEKAMPLSKTIYTFHKAETKEFINQYIDRSKHHMTHYFEFDFPIKKSMKQHRKKVEKIRVGCWRLFFS